MNRRSLLGMAVGGLVSGGMLAGCTINKLGSTTTVVLNVAKVNAYAQAGLNGAATVLGVLGMVPSLTLYTTPLKAAVAVLQMAVGDFVSAAGNNVTVRYDDATTKTKVDSILNAIQQIVDLITSVIVEMAKSGLKIAGDNVSKVQVAHDALSTIVSVFTALLTPNLAFGGISGSSAIASSPRLALSESKALRQTGPYHWSPTPPLFRSSWSA